MTNDLTVAVAIARYVAAGEHTTVSEQRAIEMICNALEQAQRSADGWRTDCERELRNALDYRGKLEEAQAEITRLKGREELRGTWPNGCQRAFVEGAQWWENEISGGTMFQSDRRAAETEAERRYTEREGSKHKAETDQT